ncbi:MAG TPA: S1 family peptidase [Labilithrix sp.]
MDAPREDVGHAQERVIGGKNSDSSQDAVVMVVWLDPSGQGLGSCTGTMLAPNLVMTARHCVSDTEETAACDQDGNPIGGSGAIYGTHTASSMLVFKGTSSPKFFETGNPNDVKPDGVGAKIMDDGGKSLCNHDVALIVLKDPIKGIPIAPIRLEKDSKVGEAFTAVGWGITSTGNMPTTRQQRTGIKIQDIGPDLSDYGPLPPNEFQVGEAICQGDSGGPALASTGAVIGVVSRGGNGMAQSQSDPAAGCINAMNIYTKVEPFKTLILSAYTAAGQDPWIEGGPDPRLAKTDDACSQATDCRSNICLGDPGQSASAVTCAQDCSDGSTCPDGETCQAVGGQQVCRTPIPDDTSTSSKGCASAPSSPSSGILAFAVAALGIAFTRRRRGSSS